MSLSVTVAMYCLLQVYVPISSYLKPQKPLLKLVAVKAVVFLTFWQASGLSLLATFGVVKDTPYMTADNINIGIGAILETFEMMLFAFLHIRAFSYKPYCTPPYRTRRWPALVHAFNFKETLDELWAGMQYMWHRMRGRETDVQARRQAALEGVFGRSRIAIEGPIKTRGGNGIPRVPNYEKSALAVQVAVEETVHVGQERQWLGVGNEYGHGLGYHSRRVQEKSEGLGEQIEREMTIRGYTGDGPNDSTAEYNILKPTEPEAEAVPRPVRGQRTSWWKNMYTRVSQSERLQDVVSDGESESSTPQRGRSQHRSKEFRKMAGRKLPHVDAVNERYDDPPPPSFIRSYRESRSRKGTSDTVTPSYTLRLVGSSTPPTPVIQAPHAISNSPPMAANPDLPPSPMSLPNSSDSFLARAFPALTDTSHSTEGLSAGATSSQSHRSRVQLGGGPLPVTSMVTVHSPVIVSHSVSQWLNTRSMTGDTGGGDSVDLSEGATRLRSSHMRSSATHDVSSPTRLSHAQAARPDGVHRDSHRSASVPKQPRVRRDQIVLPAPLASGASLLHKPVIRQHTSVYSSSPPHNTQSHSPTFASPRQIPKPPAESLTSAPSFLDSYRDPQSPQQTHLRRQGATRGTTRRHTHALIQEPHRKERTRRLSTPLEHTSITPSPPP